MSDIAAQSNAADVDGTVASYVVKAVSRGTLLIGTSAGSATAWVAGTNDLIDATHFAYWTPAANANGSLNGFTVVAKDNVGLESSSSVQAMVSVAAVNDAPTFFVGTGKITTDIIYDDYAQSVAIQSDQKILVFGRTYTGNSYDFALCRYNINGSLDSSFSNDGIVTTDLNPNSLDEGCSLAVQGDGKIIVAGVSRFVGTSNDNVAIARYNSDGSLDASFGIAGIVTTDFGNQDVLLSITLQDDGKIVGAGYCYSNTGGHQILLARYNIDGSIDYSFNNSGFVKLDLAEQGGSDIAWNVIIQKDGKILVTGSANYSGLSAYLIRYNSDGSLDTSFGDNGVIYDNINTPIIGYSVALQYDDKILISGKIGNGGDDDFTLLRYNADGSLDDAFGNNGVVITDFGGSDHGYSVQAQVDGKIIVAG
jgi:uncharacterized delta-60 repeat protein